MTFIPAPSHRSEPRLITQDPVRLTMDDSPPRCIKPPSVAPTASVATELPSTCKRAVTLDLGRGLLAMRPLVLPSSLNYSSHLRRMWTSSHEANLEAPSQGLRLNQIHLSQSGSGWRYRQRVFVVTRRNRSAGQPHFGERCLHHRGVRGSPHYNAGRVGVGAPTHSLNLMVQLLKRIKTGPVTGKTGSHSLQHGVVPV